MIKLTQQTWENTQARRFIRGIDKNGYINNKGRTTMGQWGQGTMGTDHDFLLHAAIPSLKISHAPSRAPLHPPHPVETGQQ